MDILIPATSAKIDRMERKLDRVEHKLDLVLAHLGIEVEGPDLSGVDESLREGKMILAIKRYREATGAGLKEAKDAVESRAGRL